MKKFKKSYFSLAFFTLLLAGTLVSCMENTAEDASPRLKVDKINITVIQTGRLSTGTKPRVNVTANLGYEASSDVDWISPDKPTGKGITDITLNIKENTTTDLRIGYLTITSHGLSEIIKITQTLDPDTDDGLEIGTIYLDEDFSLFDNDKYTNANGVATDPVANPFEENTIAMRDFKDLINEFNKRGYGYYNSDDIQSVYIARSYFKLGKTNEQCGLSMSLNGKIQTGKSINITLTFDVAPLLKVNKTDKTVTGSDPTIIVVEKMEGPGNVGTPTSTISQELSLSNIQSYGQWAHFTVPLYGVTSKTRIVIRSLQQGMTTSGSNQFRWFLDNIKMVKASRE